MSNNSNSPRGLTPTITIFDDVLSMEVRNGNDSYNTDRDSIARRIEDFVAQDDRTITDSLIYDNRFREIYNQHVDNNWSSWTRTTDSTGEPPRNVGFVDNISVDSYANYYDQRINMLEGELISTKAELITAKKELVEINNTLQEMQKTLKLLMEI